MYVLFVCSENNAGKESAADFEKAIKLCGTNYSFCFSVASFFIIFHLLCYSLKFIKTIYTDL